MHSGSDVLVLFVDSSAEAPVHAAKLRETLGLRAEVYDCIAAATPRIADSPPTIVIAQDELPDGSGRDFCILLKAQRKLYLHTPTFVLCDGELPDKDDLRDFGIQFVRRASYERLGAVELVRSVLFSPSPASPESPLLRAATIEYMRTKMGADVTERALPQKESTATKAEHERKVVLVADDERVIADTTAIILNYAGYKAYAVYTGIDEVERARELRPDFLISDIVKPDMNGIEAAILIRQFLPTIRILLFTGQTSFLILEFMEAARAEHGQFAEQILAKPVHPQVLLDWLASGGQAPSDCDPVDEFRKVVEAEARRNNSSAARR